MASNRESLDATLENFNAISLAFSKKLQKITESVSAEDYSLADLARVAKQFAETTKIYVELAPFYTTKQTIEGADRIIDWFAHSQEYMGEERDRIITAIRQYQEEALKESGYIDKEQYQLL